jgi:hypothetical protein
MSRQQQCRHQREQVHHTHNNTSATTIIMRARNDWVDFFALFSCYSFVRGGTGNLPLSARSVVVVHLAVTPDHWPLVAGRTRCGTSRTCSGGGVHLLMAVLVTDCIAAAVCVALSRCGMMGYGGAVDDGLWRWRLIVSCLFCSLRHGGVETPLTWWRCKWWKTND